MGACMTGDFTDDEIRQAQQEYIQEEKKREQKRNRQRQSVDPSELASQTQKSYQITATPTNVKGRKKGRRKPPRAAGSGGGKASLNVDDVDLGVIDENKSGLPTSSKYLQVRAVMYAFEKTLTIAPLEDHEMPLEDMTGQTMTRYFGGQSRARRLRRHFEAIQAPVKPGHGFERKQVFVVSDQLSTERVKRMLSVMGLLEALEDENHVIGVDHELMKGSQSKNMALMQALKRFDLQHTELLFVDSVQSAIEYVEKMGMCVGYWVKDDYGMGSERCDKIEAFFRDTLLSP